MHSLKVDRGAGNAKNVGIVSCGFHGALPGRNPAQITLARGAEPTMENAAGTVMDLIGKGGCAAVYHAVAEEDVVRIMRSPFTMIARDGEIPVFGRSAPHPRSYGTFARVPGVYVREKNVLPLEDAVRRMRAFPAQRLKIWDRGMLRPGMKADIPVFDPGEVEDRAGYDNPHRYSVAVRDVLVNGTFVLRDDQGTAERPGCVLSGSSAER